MILKKIDVQLAVIDAGLADEALRIDYSGRGMYGQGCVGIVGSPADGTMFALKLSEEVEDVDFEVLAESARTDDMGRQRITYWPGYQVEGVEQP